MARRLSRIRTFGQSKGERINPSQRAYTSALREQGSPRRKPNQDNKRIAALGRIPRIALILSCVAVAAIIISACVFTYGNGGGNNTQQVMAVYKTSKDPAPKTSSAFDAAIISSDPSAAPASASAKPSKAPVSVSADPSAVPAVVSSVPSALPASAPSASSSSQTDSGPLGSTVFKEGMSDPLVAFMQQRLMDLYYLDNAPTTQLYGPLTQEAVMCFQRAAGLPTNGFMDSQTYTSLMSQDAPEYFVGVGAKGQDVEDMISRLHKLDYIDSTPDTFTTAVKTAVEKFQDINGLVVDGMIGKSTKEMLYSSHAKEYTTHTSSTSGGQSSTSTVTVTGNITKKTNLKPAKLEAILPSALKGLGQALYDGEQQYKINSLFILSIIDYESGNGTSSLAQHQNNLGGLKLPAGDFKAFSSKAECVDYMYDLLRSKYINAGMTTIPEIGKVYCPGNTWASRITDIMQDLIDESN